MASVSLNPWSEGQLRRPRGSSGMEVKFINSVRGLTHHRVPALALLFPGRALLLGSVWIDKV